LQHPPAPKTHTHPTTTTTTTPLHRESPSHTRCGDGSVRRVAVVAQALCLCLPVLACQFDVRQTHARASTSVWVRMWMAEGCVHVRRTRVCVCACVQCVAGQQALEIQHAAEAAVPVTPRLVRCSAGCDLCDRHPRRLLCGPVRQPCASAMVDSMMLQRACTTLQEQAARTNNHARVHCTTRCERMRAQEQAEVTKHCPRDMSMACMSRLAGAPAVTAKGARTSRGFATQPQCQCDPSRSK
jgi:hypothetical protein